MGVATYPSTKIQKPIRTASHGESHGAIITEMR